VSWPKTERQQRFVALANELAEPIAARAAEVDRANSFPYQSFAEFPRAGNRNL
jgi:hypothetical protein